MRIPRLHVPHPLAPGIHVELPRQQGDHLTRVLRLGNNDKLTLFNGDGREYAGEIVGKSRDGLSVRVDAQLPERSVESALQITLAQSIARGEKMDWILQKATELGVAAIIPIVTGRTEVRLDRERAARRIAHWQAVIVSACEQSGRLRVPELAMPQNLGDWLAGLDDSGSLCLALDPDGELTTRSLPRFERASIVVGPEGGLSDADLAALRSRGFQGLRLGPRILRTETAGISALAALQAVHGDS
ncbi:MAG: 16S rRNA (uracil(1498)-N(3))-methyltransferase [Rhodanobacteraceae bacterium]